MTPSKFKALEKKWYKKLKESGFEDIEDDKYWLKQHTRSRHGTGQNNGKPVAAVLLSNEAKETYYRLAGFFLNEHTFSNKVERLIWQEHAIGTSHRTISIKLKKFKVKMARSQVLDIIHKLRDVMFETYRSKGNE